MTHARALNRRYFLLTAAAFVVATPAHADFVTAVQQKLQSQGFTEISVSYTLLGRSRIIAHGKRGTREIILNPKTGEVLRDLWTSASGTTGSSIFDSDTAEDDSEDASDDGDDDGGKGRGRGRGGSGGEGESDDSGSDGGSDNDGHSGGDGDSGGDDND